MNYIQFNPHPDLNKYIDAYWTVSRDGINGKVEKIFPDGCVDIIFNLGAECKTDNALFTMENEKVYLVGTMTRYNETLMNPETKLLGIRFKPGAFSAFYNYDSLHEVTDHTIELEKKFSPDLKKTLSSSITYLNWFFLDRLAKPNHTFLSVINDIQNNKGQINVLTLAEKHFTTARQLERKFKQYTGVTPKEFINISRYQNALAIIKNNNSKRSLLDVAFECGYYDHAHLTNEIKRFTGITPSQF